MWKNYFFTLKKKFFYCFIYYVFIYLFFFIITTRLTDFALPQNILLDASASRAPTPFGHINRWHNFLDLVLPMDTRSCSLSTIMLLRSSHSSLLCRMRKLSPTRTRPKVWRRIFSRILSMPLRHKEAYRISVL